MKILLYDMSAYAQKDLVYYLKRGGCICRSLLYSFPDKYHDAFFEKKFEEQLLLDDYDVVMSMNFFPIVAKICSRHNIKYISWVYDSPINCGHLEDYCYPTNYIFVFDRVEAERIGRMGNFNVFHLPLAVNVERMHHMVIEPTDRLTYSADISFVGQFYGNPLKAAMEYMGDYEKGYIDALIRTQFRIYGYDFIEEMITEEFTQKINGQLISGNPNQKPVLRRELHDAVRKHITHLERLVLCNMLGHKHQMNYYSGEQPQQLSHLHYGGTVGYFTEMPKVFRLSKLNLNPTLRSIQSGIPLRALDILGSGGVLFSNYQPELAEYFEDGVDAIMYESVEDALEKADYYIKNDQIRLAIAEKGYQKICEQFSYPDRIAYMFRTAGL
ncbi:MAG: DUF3880 domain-containing protein [Blautia sp.]|nr:DUF3880 domain-containing protein [Blautia sp.]